MKINTAMRNDANYIINKTLEQNAPDKAVIKALEGYDKPCYIMAIGKAAWTMAKAAHDFFCEKALGGVVITKYDHSNGEIGNLHIFEAGHPIPDENSVKATEFAISFFSKLTEKDNVVFLISGGGSALFESPVAGVSLGDMEKLSKDLINSGADITKINTVRKRLSKVKGGGFANICAPANIYCVILSDVLGNDPAAIASGPASTNNSTSADAMKIIKDFGVEISDKIAGKLEEEKFYQVTNATHSIIGSVHNLCDSASIFAKEMGYAPYIMSESMTIQAREAGNMLASVAEKVRLGDTLPLPCALIFGGETVVKVKGNGKGGRNQELALAAALGIENMETVCIFSFGSDGTDGPTDAAGGVVDGFSAGNYKELGLNANEYLDDNNSYEILKKSGDLLITGPTGTNINDAAVILIK